MSKNESLKGWCFIIIVLMIVLALWFSYPLWSYLYKDYFYNTENAEMGVFGDSYGALNTLFSGLAFAGLIISIRLQSKELSETRAELKEQSEQFKKQTETLAKQNFEATFFQLLKLYVDSVDNLNFKNSKSLLMQEKIEEENVVGKQVISILSRRMTVWNYVDRHDYFHVKINEYIDGFLIEYGMVIERYIKILDRLLKFVDRTDLSREDKFFYMGLLTAQMSKEEMTFLFYYGLYKKSDFESLYVRSGFLGSFELSKEISIDDFLMYGLYAYGDFSSLYWDDVINRLLNSYEKDDMVISCMSGKKIKLPNEVYKFKKIIRRNDGVLLEKVI
ncbi:putative phage abortive infection protein [Aeromonas sp. AE23HZ002T15]